MEAYYYNHMSKVEQAVYHAMKTGFSEMATSFLVPRMEAKELAEVFFRMRLDCPEIFWAVGFSYRSYRDSGNLEIIPEYIFEKSKVKDHKKAMKSRVEKLARQAASMNEKEKEQFVHDFICQNVHYDKLKKPYSHEIIGPMGHGVGVCEGIAKTVKILCDNLGIWCIIAISEANPEKKIKYRHAWNIVRIDGKYYHLDATFDNSLGEADAIRYDYFNLDDSKIFKDHEPVIWKVPACADGDHFYYKEKKISFAKIEEVKKRALQAAKKGKPFIFHWRGGFLTRDTLKELLDALDEAAKEKGKYLKVSLNWPQAVLHAEFSEILPEQAVVMEEANEGEQL